MIDTLKPHTQPTRPARRWPAFLRFSLRTLLLSVLLLGSATALWLHWQPWRLQTVIATGSAPDFAAFSANEQRVIWRWGGVVHVADARSGEELSTRRAPVSSMTYDTILDHRPITIAAGYQELQPAQSQVRDDLNRSLKHVSMEFTDGQPSEALRFMSSLTPHSLVATNGARTRLQSAPLLNMFVRNQEYASAMDLCVHAAGLDWSFNAGVFTIFVPDPSHAITLNHPIRVWDLETGDSVATLSGSESPFKSLFLSPNGRYVMAAFDGGGVRVWDVSTGANTSTFSMDLILINPDSRNRAALTHAAISDDGKHVLGHVTGSEGFEALDLTSTPVSTMLAETHPERMIGLSNDHKVACFQSYHDEIEIWNLETNSRIKAYPAVQQAHLEGRAPLFSPAGDRVLVETLYSVRLFDSATGVEINRCSPARNTAFSSDRDIFAIADFGFTELRHSSDGSLLVALPQSPQTLATLGESVRNAFITSRSFKPPAPIFATPALQFSRDGKRLLAACGSNALGIWTYQRPESGWGVFYIPEFWLTLLISGLWVRGLRRRSVGF